MHNSILLIDDDAAFRRVYSGLLRDEGYEVAEADDRPSARRAFDEGDYPVVLLDLMLPPDGTVDRGLEQLANFLSERPDTKVIVASGAGDTAFMVRAVNQGAYDFLTKPIDPDVLLIVVERAMARAALEDQIESLQSSLSQRAPSGGMIGESDGLKDALTIAERVAPTELPVLILGEPGTGKELMARAVHELGDRAEKSFVPINCGALPADLLESTLFGHAKGAFTGAEKERGGLFVEADGGTLFFDEIGDMPPELQVKLLRVLETGDILPVGMDRPRKVDVRVVSATNRDLRQMQEQGEFREDLFWRINGASISLPPLRERASDIPLLAEHFLNQAASLSRDGRPKRLSPAARDALFEHEWPGNLRELRHEMQRATVMAADSPVIEAELLSFVRADEFAQKPPDSLQGKVEALEKREIERALARHDGNRTHTADELGLSRQGLLNKMNRYEIE